MWHVLDVNSIWMKEFASALTHFVPTMNWVSVMRSTGAFENWEREEDQTAPPLRVRYFPQQRGYSRFPISLVANLGRRQTRRMLSHSVDPSRSPLICTTPYYAVVAERWPGPVIYYQTDLTFAYHGLASEQVCALDTRLCRVASAVCPNSQRIGHYMVEKAKCDPAKIVVVPNATRQQNVLSQAPSGPARLPADLQDLPRPVIGVLGNLAANLDWRLLLETVERTPDLSWAFIGPYSMEVHDAPHSEARDRLLARGGRVRFTGPKPYGLLQDYARALDAAVLPYRRKEPTFSGSSTRFYEHLAACRPMLATRGFEELLHQEPLLRLVDNADDLTTALSELQKKDFKDGYEQTRWRASCNATWNMRAATLIEAARTRCPRMFDSVELPPAVTSMAKAGRLRGDFRSRFQLVTPN